MKYNQLKSENGFTLLELVISVVLIGIIGTIIISVVANQTVSFNRVLNHTVGLTDSRKAIQMVRKDIQNLTVANIITMTSDELGFIDNNGANVTYLKTGSNFTRNDNTILNGLDQSPFKYLNIDQQVTAV
ncbi:MAG: prepilin-type N-terminal cleavage/methylation domain-containing protein, partial [Gammaproteobacteria bacterium]|nr:prepilin-type N-terminal cleavage/methylation domain-containing protein [Gammaproteobacteria bacterium]